MSCSVQSCNNVKRFKPEGISFFRFPKNKEVLDEWLKALHINSSTWTWTENKFVCSKHFDEVAYDEHTHQKRLHKSAIPTKLLQLSGERNLQETSTLSSRGEKNFEDPTIFDVNELGIRIPKEPKMDLNLDSGQSTVYNRICYEQLEKHRLQKTGVTKHPTQKTSPEAEVSQEMECEAISVKDEPFYIGEDAEIIGFTENISDNAENENSQETDPFSGEGQIDNSSVIGHTDVPNIVSVGGNLKPVEEINPKKRKLDDNKTTPRGPVEFEEDTFLIDLFEAFAAADIPLHKLRNPVLRRFLSTYCRRAIPAKDDFDKSMLWIGLANETTERGDAISVTAGALDPAASSEPHVIANTFVPVADPQFVSHLTETQVDSLCADHDGGRRVSLLVTDGTEVMLEAAQLLKSRFPEMIHLNCFVDELKSVCGTVRKQFADVDRLLGNTQKVVWDVPAWKQDFKPPPESNDAKSWLETVCYYSSNFARIKQFIFGLDGNAVGVGALKNLWRRADIKYQMHVVRTRFSQVISAMNALQNDGLSLIESLNVFNDAMDGLSLPNATANAILQNHIETVRGRTGYLQLLSVAEELNTLVVVDDVPVQIKSENEHFRFAPVTSVSARGSLERFKSMLNDERSTFTIGDSNRHVLHLYCPDQC